MMICMREMNIYTDEQVQEFKTKLNELSNMYWK